MSDRATRYSRNTVSFLYAVAVHGAIAAVLLFSFSWTVLPGVERGKDVPAIVQARVVSETRVEQELARLKEQERLKERRELEQQERLDQLLKKANEVDQRRKQNEAELEKLKKQQVAEKKKMVTLEKKRKAEEKRVAALEKKRKQQAAQEKKRKDEKRRKVAERKRKEKQVADRKRKQEQQRQRELQEQLAREQVQRRARNALERYVPIIQQHVERNWNRPPNIPPGMRAKVRVRLSPGGEVRDVRVVVSSGDPVFDRSVEYAVYKSTPLPLPDDPSVAEYLRREQILFTFSPSEV